MLESSLVRLPKEHSRRWIGVAATAAVMIGVGVGYHGWRSHATSAVVNSNVETAPPQLTTVTALGRLEPKGEVIQLSAPSSASGNRVEQLLVQEGDRVQVGQVIAVLDSRDRLQAAYNQAQEAVKVAQAELAITQAGAKQGEIAAQQAEIARLEAQQQGDIEAQQATLDRLTAELHNAEMELTRYQALYQEGAISASTLDSKRLMRDTARRSVEEARAVLARIESTSPAALNQARATLERITEVRPVDVQVKQAEVDRALAALEQASADLEQTDVRSPLEGEVLAVHTRAGEVVASEGIVDIGQTQQMYAVAEVYQSDIHRVKPGQRARVTSNSLPTDLWGTVERIDAQVQRQTVVNTDPSANIDGRVIEVHVALEPLSSQQAARLTNLQVTVVLEQ